MRGEIDIRWSTTCIAPGISSGLMGASLVVDSDRCSGVRGIRCDPGTTNKHASLYNALHSTILSLPAEIPYP